MPELNTAKLTLARQFRELSQKELSERVDITQASLSRIEKGDLQPSEKTQSDLISALGFPSSFFYDEYTTTASTLSFHAYRKKASVSATKIHKIHAELSIKSQHQEIIYSRLQPNSPQEIPKLVDNPAMLALYLRDLWKIGDAPIENLTQHIENMGIDIFLCNFKDIQVDGVTSTTSQGLKAIFLNINQPADRYRFSLAHELCHYLLHGHEFCATPAMEEQANQFASFLLMPESALKEALKTTRLRDFAQLKQTWKVSMAALIYRAKQLECISAAQSTSLYKQMSMHGFRTVEPYAFEQEKPQRVHNLLKKLASDDALPSTLHISSSDFEQFYPNFYAAQEMPVT